MTPYTPKDITEDWEFKILRSVSGAFRKPEFLRTVLAEEERAGWTLLEKFDNNRIRLKRPARARSGDATLDFDARRTFVGMKPGAMVAIILSCVFGTMAIGGIVAYLVANNMH